jgi:signal transduction histidine kinase
MSMNLPHRVIQTIWSICNKIPALWLSAHPLRASFEGLFIGGVGAWVGALMTADDHAHSIEKVSPFAFMVFIFWGLFTMVWCALRARFYGNWWQGIVIDILAGIGLAILPTTVFLYALSRLPALFFPMSIVYGACMLIGYPSLHGLLRLWIASRRQLQWALTSAQLLAALGSVVVFILVITVVEMLFDPGGLGPTPVVSYILLVIFILALSGIFLMTMLPFLILFSYLFMRPIARRIQQLVDATSAIRAGKYHIRIPIAGENEIAQLQADFNSMASDLERYVQEVRDERDTVAKLSQNRRQLIASVGHELRTPVATLRGHLESLLAQGDEHPPATWHRDLAVMERETLRLQRLIDDLFALSQAEVGALSLNCQPSDIATLIHMVGDAVTALAWQHYRVEVIIEVAERLPPVMVDAQRTTQVILNLVHNAIRHTPPGGLVVIQAAQTPDAVTVEVRDTGEGIAAVDLPYIWERFYRGKATGNRPTDGAGLGLALVKELTEAMGGSVSVESFEGIGSCFTISLSLASRISSPER